MKFNKAIFFDRDGVINDDLGYVHKIDDFRFYEDFFSCAEQFKKHGYKLIVVTNQSGIQRGLYTIKDFLILSCYMQGCIYERLGFYLDRIYFCPLLQDSIRRKPSPGMLLAAKETFALDMSKCLIVGDNISDVEAGYNAGLSNLFLLQRKLDDFSDMRDLNSKYHYHKIRDLSQISTILQDNSLS